MDDRQMASITKLLQTASDRQKDASGETSAFNILSVLQLERYETRTHSKIIFFLLNSSCGSSDKAGFLHLFLQAIHIPEAFLNGSWKVYRERTFDGGSSRIDFVLESKNFCAVIEMKVDARDGDSQLARYASFCRKKRKEYMVYYLTLDGHAPEEQSVRGVEPERFRCISFEKEIVSWLESCVASVETDGYQYAFLKQYLGAVFQAAGIDNEGIDVKDLLDSSDMAQAAQIIARSFREKMDDVTACFFQKLCEEIEKKTKLKTLPYTNCADIFLDTLTKGSKNYHVVIGIDVDTYLYVGFGFSEETEDGGHPFIPLADAEAYFPDVYRKWIEKLDALENFPKFRQTKWARWLYWEDPEGARLNFKDHSAQIKLIDEMAPQCKLISDCLVKDLIGPLCS